MEQKIRTRCGSARTFERRFQPILQNEEDGSVIVEPWDVPPAADYRYWWTVVDGGDKLTSALDSISSIGSATSNVQSRGVTTISSSPTTFTNALATSCAP